MGNIELNCHEEVLQFKELGPDLTVGREFYFACDALAPDVAGRFKVEKAQIVLPEADQLKLVLLKVESVSPLKLRVTSYKVGDHKLSAVLTDGEEQIVLHGTDFVVKSVIKPEEPVMEPYGPMAPMSIAVPWFYWAILAAIVVLVAGSVALKIRSYLQRKRLIDSLREHDSAASPYAQFNHEFRRIQREYVAFAAKEIESEDARRFVVDIEKKYLLYVTRRFRIPALLWSAKQVAIDVRKNLKSKDIKKVEVDEALAQLENIYREIEKAKTSEHALFSRDVVQLAKVVRVSIDKVEKICVNADRQKENERSR